jgi:hypothetical protein
MDDHQISERDGQQAAGVEPDWDAVVLNEQKVEETLAASATALNSNLGRPGAAEDLSAMLAQVLPSQEPTENLFEAVRGTISDYLGEDTNGLIWWLSKDSGSFPDRMELASKYLSTESLQTLRFVFARYGNDLRMCLRLFRDLTHDWRLIQNEVWYNLATQRHQVNIDIRKMNEELLRLECAPVSVLVFARILVDSLRKVPDIAEYLNADSLATFRSSVSSFYELLDKADEETPETAERPTDETDASA